METYRASLGHEWHVTDEEHYHSDQFLDEIDERMAAILDRWDGRVSISGPHPSGAYIYADSYPMWEAAG